MRRAPERGLGREWKEEKGKDFQMFSRTDSNGELVRCAFCGVDVYRSDRRLSLWFAIYLPKKKHAMRVLFLNLVSCKRFEKTDSPQLRIGLAISDSVSSFASLSATKSKRESLTTSVLKFKT